MKKSGFTLVEQIVALAIIAIVLVAILPIFVGSFRNIMSFGRKTKNVMAAQSEVGKAIQGNPTDHVEEEAASINLTFTKNGTSITTGPIQGRVIRYKTNENNNTTLSTFVPN